MKSIIEKYRKGFFAEPRDIIWIYIGVNIGTETCGHGEGWIRPCLIIRRFTINKKAHYIVAPLTSNGTYFSKYDRIVYIKDFHHKIKSIDFNSKKENNLKKDKQSYIMLNQLKTISDKRFIRKYYLGNKKYAKLGVEEFLEIKSKIAKIIIN